MAELGGGAERGLGLVGALLCLTQLSDGLGERGELDDQGQRRERLVVGEVPVGGDEPGGLAEQVSYRGGRRDPPVLLAGGAVEPVGCLPQDTAAERGGGDPQRVPGRPRGVGSSLWAGEGPGTDLGGGMTGDAGGVLPQLLSLLDRQVRDRLLPGCPPLGEPGPGQVGGEFAAAVPDRVAVLGGVAGQRDRVPSNLPGVLGAGPDPDLHAGLAEAGEELLRVCRGGGGGRHVAPQRDARRLAEPAPCRLLSLRASRAPVRGAVGRRGGPEPVALLGSGAGVADPVAGVPGADPGAVLAGQHRYEVDVVGSVADGDPPHALVVLTMWGQPGAGHHVPRNLRPLRIGKHTVFGSGTHRAVPDRFRARQAALPVVGQPEPGDEAAEVAPAMGAKPRLQAIWVKVAGHDVRIGVLLTAARAVQVPNKPGHVVPARADLPDHRRPAPNKRMGSPGPGARERLAAVGPRG